MKYKDANGKLRSVKVTERGVRRVVENVSDDPVDLCCSAENFLKTLYCLQVEDPATESPDEWLEAHHGEAGLRAMEAGIEAIIEFGQFGYLFQDKVTA